MTILYILVGPTASGKSKLALELAKKMGAEIVSADSMSIYRQMDVGTAKPLPEERSLIAHHLIDICDPWESFSAGMFARQAKETIEEIESRGKKVLLVGGTGLYIKSLTEGLVETVDANWELRHKFSLRPKEDLYQELEQVDPEAAARISPNDMIRIVRALEVFHLTGKPLSQQQKNLTQPPLECRPCYVGLLWPRPILYQRIEERVDKMILNGLEDETKRLLEMKQPLSRTASQAIGYRDMISYLEGKISEENLIPEIKQNTRRFAKRQMTWLRRFPVQWIEMSEEKKLPSLTHDILSIFEKFTLSVLPLFLCFCLCFCLSCQRTEVEIDTSIKVWGSQGITDGCFNKPRALTFSEKKKLYVVDLTGRVQIFSEMGEFQGFFRTPAIEAGRPTGLGISSKGNILVADTHYHQILCYSPEGKLLFSFGEFGNEAHQFIYVTDVVASPDGFIYVSNYGGALGKYDKIQKFDAEGKFIQAWGSGGTETGQFDRPMSLALDEEGNVIVADACNHRIQKFSSDGVFLEQWGTPGDQAGELSYPYGVALGPKGDIYVSEFGNNRIQRFSKEGKSLGYFGIPGRFPGMFANPWDIAVGKKGEVYISDALNHRVQRIPSYVLTGS